MTYDEMGQALVRIETKLDDWGNHQKDHSARLRALEIVVGSMVLSGLGTGAYFGVARFLGG
jgi:hypothetical protein